jgi:hypothetical protein
MAARSWRQYDASITQGGDRPETNGSSVLVGSIMASDTLSGGKTTMNDSAVTTNAQLDGGVGASDRRVTNSSNDGKCQHDGRRRGGNGSSTRTECSTAMNGTNMAASR